MASKVNTKFVVILTASVLVLFGAVAGLGYYVINKTGSTWANRGDRLAAKGDFAAAAVAYGRAVGHEKNNVNWLRKWDDALSKWAPPTENEFNEAYSKFHLTILQQIANALQTDAAAHGVFLDAMYREYANGAGRADIWEQFFNLANTSIERLDTTNPEVQRLQRYRGLAQLNRLRGVEGTDDDRKIARKDLQAAIAADPNDVESALGLIDLSLLETGRKRRTGDTGGADVDQKKVAGELDALIEKFPKDPRPLLRRWEMTTEQALAKAINAVEQRKTRDSVAPGLDPVIAAAKAAPREVADVVFLRRLGARISAARPTDGAAQWLAVVDAALEKSPDDSSLMILKGQALAQMEEHDRAIATFQSIIERPDPTVTNAGKQLRENRKVAMQMITERRLSKWEHAGAADKPALMVEVKKSRDALADRVGANHPALLRINALLAVTEMRFGEAVKDLSDLNNLTGGQDVETLYMLAYALKGEGSMGAAVQQYDRILQLDPGQVPALMGAAEIELRMDQIEPASKRLEKVLQLDPENETAKRQMELVDATRNQTKDITVSDPVVQIMIKATRLVTQPEPDIPGAIKLLDDGLKTYPDDYRLINHRVSLYVQQGTVDPAIELVSAALKRNPSSNALKQLLTYLEVKDPLLQQVQIIEQTDAPPLEKNLLLYATYRTFGQPDKAAPVLAAAVKEAPGDVRVVEYQFVEALEARKMDDARALAAKAAELNIDQVGGLMFQARLEMVEGKQDAAVATLGRVTQQLPLSAPAWRLLGQAQMTAGRVDLAIEAFKKAVQFRPNDTMMIKPYLSALMMLNRQVEALELLREARARNAADEMMFGLWLELEEAVGDKAKALENRKRLLVTRPTDKANRIALARLELGAKDWDNAAKLIEGLRADEPLASALLEARMLGLRDDLDGARAKIASFVETAPDDAKKLEALLGLCDTLMEFGREDQAFVALRDARKYQDAKRMEADRRLGDALFDRARNEEAVDAYSRVLASGTDKDNVVAKRRAEALLRLKRWDDVVSAVAAIEKVTKRDFQTVMLLADAAVGQGDMRKARQYLDEAVALAPTNPMGFFRRATLNESDPDQFALVMKDLDAAIKLRPDFVQARARIASLYFQKGRDNEAIAALTAAVEAVPEDDGLRLSYIQQLQRLKRVDDAKIAAATAVKVRAASVPIWYSHAGDVYASARDYRGAYDYYRKGYDLKPTLELIGRLVDTLLHLTPPQGAEALRAIDSFPKEQAELAKPLLLILKSRVYAATGKDADAQKTMAEAWPLVKNSPGQTVTWLDQLDEVLKRDPVQIEKFVRGIAPDAEALGPTGTVMLASRIARDSKRWPDIIQMLEGVETKTRDPQTLWQLHQTRAQIYYFSQKFENAVEEYKAGLVITPDSPEFNNNLAYTYARDLNEREKAMPYAIRAAVLDPSNPSVLDTLGWLQLKAGELNKADETLARALNLATQSGEKLPILIHTAETKWKLGDKAGGREFLEKARKLGTDEPVHMKPNQIEFDEVNKLIGGA